MKRKLKTALASCVIVVLLGGIYNAIVEDWDFKYHLYVLIIGFLPLAIFYFFGTYLFNLLISFLKARYELFTKVYSYAFAGIILALSCLTIFLFLEGLFDYTPKTFLERFSTNAFFFMISGLVISITYYYFNKE
jgi:hypothetical protein